MKNNPSLDTAFEQLYNTSLSAKDRVLSLEAFIAFIEEHSITSSISYLQSLLELLLIQLTSTPVNEHALSQYGSLLHQELSLLSYRYIVLDEDASWISQYLYVYLSKRHYDVTKLSTLTTADTNDSTIIICCDNKEHETLPADNTIFLYKYLQYTFFANPQFYYLQNKNERVSNPKGILTGMSYFRDAIPSDMLDLPILNLANSSQDLFYDFAMFQRAYEANANSITYAILGLAQYSLRYDESLSKTRELQLLPYIDFGYSLHHNTALQSIAAFLNDTRAKIDHTFGLDACKHLFSAGYLSLYGNDMPCDTLVFNSDDVAPIYLQEIEGKYHKPYEETFMENKKILKEYLDYCSSHNLQILIVLPPCSSWYRMHWNEIYYTELIQYLQQLSEQYSFDLLDFTLEEWDDMYFRDYAHTNRLGAQRVCDIINEYLQHKE